MSLSTADVFVQIEKHRMYMYVCMYMYTDSITERREIWEWVM